MSNESATRRVARPLKNSVLVPAKRDAGPGLVESRMALFVDRTRCSMERCHDADCGGPIPAFVAAHVRRVELLAKQLVRRDVAAVDRRFHDGRPLGSPGNGTLYRPGRVLEPRYQFRQVRVTITRLGHRLDGSPTPPSRIGACTKEWAVSECGRTLDPYICPASVHVGSAVRGGLRPSKDRFSRRPA